MGWIRIRMGPELLPGSGPGINHSGSATLVSDVVITLSHVTAHSGRLEQLMI